MKNIKEKTKIKKKWIINKNNTKKHTNIKKIIYFYKAIQ